MRYLTKFLVVIGCIGCFTGTAYSEIVDQVIAVVNRKVITLYHLQQAEKELLAQRSLSVEDSPEARRQKVLDWLIERELIRQEAEDSGILINDEELDAALEDIKQRNNLLSDEQLKAAVNQEGRTWDEFLEEIREQIRVAKLISREVRSQVEITEEEVEEYYQANADRFAQSPPIVHISHILLKVNENATNSEIQAVKNNAEQVIREFRAGTDFATLAKQYSDDPSAETGGELGKFKEGELAAPFDIAFRMSAGDISNPVQSDRGFHIIYVQEKTGGEQATFEKAQPLIRQKLFEEKSGELYQKWVAELKERAYIEIK